MAQKPGDRKNEARERARVRREQQRKAERRRQLLTSGGIVLAVVLVVVVIVVVKISTSGTKKQPNVSAPAPTTVTGAIAGVQPANFDAVGIGTSQGGLQAVTGQAPLTANGVPEVLFIGAEYCPYCAAERWAITTALSRFGTFSGLQTTASTSNDVYPNTPTLSFLTSTYKSSYLTFTTRETEDRNEKPLQSLTSAQTKIFAALAPKGGIPFLDIGNKYFLNGAQFDPNTLKGLTASQVASELSNPTSAIGKAVLGSANQLTAAICTITDNNPGSVCTSAGVTAAAKTLSSGSGSGSSS